MDSATSPIEAYGPLYNLIMSAPKDVTSISNEQMACFIRELQECGRDTYDKMQNLSKEFESLREKNLELEETVKLLHDNLDKQRAAMTEGDVESHRNACADIYSSFWNELDFDSQEFFITAHYLYERSQAQNTDFSPVIIEFCRIFENELLEKIFDDFIQEQARRNRMLSYSNRVYVKVENAINSQNSDGNFFLSSMDMLKLLAVLNRRFSGNCYEKELQDYTRRHGFDNDRLSDRNGFIGPAKSYVNDFRNTAAHPNFMREAVATECRSQTSALVSQFIAAKH